MMQKIKYILLICLVSIGGISLVLVTTSVHSQNKDIKSIYTAYFPVIATEPLAATVEQIAFPEIGASDLLFHPTESGHLFVSFPTDGIWESFDNGVTWVRNSMRARAVGLDMRIDDPNKLYVTTFISGGFYRSYDGGQNWERSDSYLYFTNSIISHPISPTVLLIGTTNHPEGPWGGWILKSEDDGDSWGAVSGELANIKQFMFDPFNSHIVYARNRRGIMKSMDDGDSWEASSNGLPSGIENEIYNLAIHPSLANRLYLATSSGVYLSDDGAANWALLWPENEVTAVTIGADALYIATENGLFTSWDGGLNWSQYAQCGQGLWVTKLLIDPVNPSQIWMLSHSGLWRCILP